MGLYIKEHQQQFPLTPSTPFLPTPSSPLTCTLTSHPLSPSHPPSPPFLQLNVRPTLELLRNAGIKVCHDFINSCTMRPWVGYFEKKFSPMYNIIMTRISRLSEPVCVFGCYCSADYHSQPSVCDFPGQKVTHPVISSVSLTRCPVKTTSCPTDL